MIKKISQREILLVLVAAVGDPRRRLGGHRLRHLPEWKYYQSEFGAIVSETFADVDPATLPSGVQQIWVEKLDRVDRCTTCHLGVGWKGLEECGTTLDHPPDPRDLRQPPDRGLRLHRVPRRSGLRALRVRRPRFCRSTGSSPS